MRERKESGMSTSVLFFNFEQLDKWGIIYCDKEKGGDSYVIGCWIWMHVRYPSENI